MRCGPCRCTPRGAVTTDAFNGRNLGLLAFINAALINAAAVLSGAAARCGGDIRTARQIQCMVLSPRIHPKEDDETGEETAGGKAKKEAAAAEEEIAATTTNPGLATFLALQLYARH